MSGIYIPDMELPKSFFYYLKINKYGVVFMDDECGHEIIFGEAISVPDHGMLIEKGKTHDACYTHFEDYMNGKIDGKTALLNILKEIKAAPTVIPASESGDVK